MPTTLRRALRTAVTNALGATAVAGVIMVTAVHPHDLTTPNTDTTVVQVTR